MKSSPSIDSMGYDLELAEPYYTEDGAPAVALISTTVLSSQCKV